MQTFVLNNDEILLYERLFCVIIKLKNKCSEVSENMTTQLKIRRQNRWNGLTKILSILIIIACMGSIAKDHLFAYVENVLFPNSIHHIEYNVIAGDTLWNLAGKTVQVGEDVRDKIIAIQKTNGLTPTQSIAPGQTLRIPMKSPVDPGMRYTLLKE